MHHHAPLESPLLPPAAGTGVLIHGTRPSILEREDASLGPRRWATLHGGHGTPGLFRRAPSSSGESPFSSSSESPFQGRA